LPDLDHVFKTLRELLQVYRPPLESKNDLPGNFDLYSVKDITAFGRKFPEMYFAGVVMRKGYVGFYFMPVYNHPQIKDRLEPGLLKLLKGKSCFHIKRVDASLLESMRAALQVGFSCYQEQGWV